MSAENPARRNWRRWLRVGIVVLVVVILSVEAWFVWPHLEQAWDHIGEINWWWVLACIVAALASMDSYAQVQRVLMGSAGVRVRQRESLAVILASNSISQTMPSGQVLASDPERISGVTVVKTGMLVMSDRRLSTPLSTGLTNYWQAVRNATSGWQVQEATPGAKPVKLAGEQGRPAPDIMTTINQNEQLTLGDAVVEVAQPATVMSFDAETGGILAMAQNDAAADHRIQADIAYPTGSTLDPVFGAIDDTATDADQARARWQHLGLGLTFTVPGVVGPPGSSSASVSAASFRPQNFTATMLNMGILGVSVARSLKGSPTSVPPYLIKDTPTKVSGGELGAMDAATVARVAAQMAVVARRGDASDLTGAPGLRALVGTNGPAGPGWFVGISGGKVIVVYCEGDASGTAALQVAQKYYRLD